MERHDSLYLDLPDRIWIRNMPLRRTLLISDRPNSVFAHHGFAIDILADLIFFSRDQQGSKSTF